MLLGFKAYPFLVRRVRTSCLVLTLLEVSTSIKRPQAPGPFASNSAWLYGLSLVWDEQKINKHKLFTVILVKGITIISIEADTSPDFFYVYI